MSPVFDIERAVAIEEDGSLRLVEGCAADCAGRQRVANAFQPFGRARVLDVFGRGVTTQRRSGRQHARKEILGKIERTRGVDPSSQAFAAHDIERGVDKVGQPRVRRMGVGMEGDNASGFVDFNEIRIMRMVVWVEKERNVGAGNCVMPGPEPRKINGKHRVAVHDQKFGVEFPERGKDSAPRSSRFAVVDQADGNREVDANQPFVNRIGPVVHHHDSVGEAMRAQKFELMQKERLAARPTSGRRAFEHGGRSRVPFPPARMTACFMADFPDGEIFADRASDGLEQIELWRPTQRGELRCRIGEARASPTHPLLSVPKFSRAPAQPLPRFHERCRARRCRRQSGRY
jgi:hypothetical protein